VVVKKIFSSAAFRVLNLLISVTVAFFMTPFIIRSLGDEYYGLWVLVSAIFGFYGILDFGVSVATQRSIAQALAKGDTDAANEAVITAFVLFCGIGVATLVVSGVVAGFGESILGDTSRLHQFRVVIALLGLAVALEFPTYAVAGIYSANFRYDLAARIHLVKFLGRSAIIYATVKMGGGIISLAATTLVTDTLAGGVMIALSHRLAPWLTWRMRFFNIKHVRELVNFGGAFLFVSLCERGRNALPSFGMNATVGLSGVTQYGVARQIYDYCVQFLNNIFGVFQPLFVRHQSVGKHEENERDFLFLIRIAFFAAIVLALGVVSCAKDFIQAWLGDNYLVVLMPLYILVIGGVFHTSLQANTQILLAYSKQKQLAILSGIEVGLSALLLMPLAAAFKLEGVSVAILLPAIVSRLIFQPILLRKELKIDWMQYVSIVLRSVLAIVVGCVAIFYIRQFVPGTGYFKVLMMGFMSLIISLPLVFGICLDHSSRERLMLQLKVILGPKLTLE